jgi:hypothetical protein
MKIRITENTFKNIFESLRLNDIIRKYTNRIKAEGVGYQGQIMEDDFLDKNNSLPELGDELYDCDDEQPNTNSKIFQIWSNYAKAMERNYPTGVIEYCRFVYYLNQSTTQIFQFEDNYIIGQFQNGFFKPSHFAPSSLKGGVNTIGELIKYDNIVFAVTEELKIMLSKLGAFSSEDLIFPMIFRDMIVNKHIVFTNPKIMAEILYKIQSHEITNPNQFQEITYNDLIGESVLNEIEFNDNVDDNVDEHISSYKYSCNIREKDGMLKVVVAYKDIFKLCDISFGYIENGEKNYDIDYYHQFNDSNTFKRLKNLLFYIKKGYQLISAKQKDCLGIYYEPSTESRAELYKKMVHHIDPSLRHYKSDKNVTVYTYDATELEQHIIKIYIHGGDNEQDLIEKYFYDQIQGDYDARRLYVKKYYNEEY